MELAKRKIYRNNRKFKDENVLSIFKRSRADLVVTADKELALGRVDTEAGERVDFGLLYSPISWVSFKIQI